MSPPALASHHQALRKMCVCGAPEPQFAPRRCQARIRTRAHRPLQMRDIVSAAVEAEMLIRDPSNPPRKSKFRVRSSSDDEARKST